MVLHLRLLRRGVQIFGHLTHTNSAAPHAYCLEATCAAASLLNSASAEMSSSSSSSSWTGTTHTDARTPYSNGSSCSQWRCSAQQQHPQQQQHAVRGLQQCQQQQCLDNTPWHSRHHQQQQHLPMIYSAPHSCATHLMGVRRQQQWQQCGASTAIQSLPHLHPHHRCYHQDKQQQQQLRQWQKHQATPSKHTPSTATPSFQEQSQQQQQQQVPGSSWASLPNLLSLSRVVSGPCSAYLVATQQWPLAFALTAAAGVTDWADGYLARRLGHTSKLGSYLDPLADKVLIASVVGTMGWNSMLPGWLAMLVVGRDTAQVAGMFVYRLGMFGGRWPGAAAFFDVDAAVPQQQQQQQQKQQDLSTEEGSHTGVAGQQATSNIDSSRSSTSNTTGPTAAAAAESGLPSIKPLMVSKVNTALVLLLVAGCMTQQWQGLPGQEVLDALELAVAGTTAASAAAYARLHWTGRLLSSSKA